MSLALLQTALLLPFEQLVNGMLALDPAARHRIDALQGRCIGIFTSAPQATLFVSFRGSRVHLAVVHADEPDASLHGPLAAMLGLLHPGKALTSLYPQGIELRGNTACVQQARQLLQTLELDWEYHLARVLGDIPTQALGKGLRQARAFAGDSAGRLRENLSEFLQEESGLLVTPDELEQRYAAIAALKLQVDRLQARLERIR